MVEGEISFGRFRLDLARRELRRDETRVAAQPPSARHPLCIGLSRGQSRHYTFWEMSRAPILRARQALWGAQPIGLIHGDLPQNEKIDLALLKLG